MTKRRRIVPALAAVAALLGVATEVVEAQDPRLGARLAEPVRAQVQAVVDTAAGSGLPTEPLIDRALQGVAMGAEGDRVLQAVRRLAGELASARAALGPTSTPEEIVAGASALRAGAAVADLARLRERRGDRSLMVAAGVLADLVAVGVPADTAVAAVLALAILVDDAEYVAFRRNVERDISLGASPVAALGVRLASAEATALGADAAQPGTGGPAQPRKP